MTVLNLRAGNAFLRDPVSGLRKPSQDDLLGLLLSGRLEIMCPEESLLLRLPCVSNLVSLGISMESAGDGSLSVCSSLKEEGPWESLWTGPMSSFRETLTNPVRSRWLQFQGTEPFLIEGLQVSGDPDPGPVIICSKTGDRVTQLEGGSVSVGGAKRKQFWVKNLSETPLRPILSIELPEGVQRRIWLLGETGRTQRVVLDLLQPGEILGPLWLEAHPLAHDRVDTLRCYLRVAADGVYPDDNP